MCCRWVSKFISRQGSKCISDKMKQLWLEIPPSKTASHSLPVSFFQASKARPVTVPNLPQLWTHTRCGGLWGEICHLRTSRHGYIICSQPAGVGPGLEPVAGSTCKSFTSTRDNTSQLADFSSGQGSQGPTPSSSGSQSPGPERSEAATAHRMKAFPLCHKTHHLLSQPFAPWGMAGDGYLLLSPFLLFSLPFPPPPHMSSPRRFHGKEEGGCTLSEKGL